MNKKKDSCTVIQHIFLKRSLHIRHERKGEVEDGTQQAYRLVRKI